MAGKAKRTKAAPAPAREHTSVKRVENPLTAASALHARVKEIVTVQRQAIQARRGSYRAAMNPRSRVQTPYGGSGDQHVDQWSRRMLRETSRDMDRNADTFRVLNDAFTCAVVGRGVKYRPTTSDTEWNRLAARVVHDLMSRDRDGIDIRGLRSGYRWQYDFVRSFAVDGEAAVLKLDGLKIQPIESEQISNGGSTSEREIDGVRMDERGRPIAFHLAPYGPSGAVDYGTGEQDDYPADVVEWVANRNRFSQTRGVPMVVASLDDWERLDSFKESEIIAAEQGSQIYGAIEHQPDDLGSSTPFTPQDSVADPSQTMRGGVANTSLGAQVDWQPTVAGAILDLPRGMKYVPVNPQRPNKDAVPFMLELVRQFCANAGLPYEFVYNDVRGLSWSVNRALVQMARDRVSIWQEQFFGPVFANIYRWLVSGLILSGALPPNDEWDKLELSWEQISWPDEGAEYEAQERGLLKGLTTRHRVHGPHWRDIMEERFVELGFAAELAQKHNAAFPEFAVSPMFFLGFETEAPASPPVEEKPDNRDERGERNGREADR
jgi:capsid protein